MNKDDNFDNFVKKKRENDELIFKINRIKGLPLNYFFFYLIFINSLFFLYIFLLIKKKKKIDLFE